MALVQMQHTVKELREQGIEFYPIETRPIAVDSAVTLVGQFDGTMAQSHTMRATIS